jgi:abortive infection bacteriophage resistance protein
VINLCSQSTNGSILKNLCQAKQDKHMNKKIMTIPLVQHLWLANNQVRIDQVLLLSIKYLWKQLDHKNKVFKNESIKDMK